MTAEMIRLYPKEEFREIEVDSSLKLRYAISNYGRMVSFSDEIKYGRLLKGMYSDGYKVFRFKIYRGTKIINSHFFIYKLVAQYFIPKTSDDQDFVIHLDHKRSNDDARNLKWVTAAERLDHIRKSPAVIEARKAVREHNVKWAGLKLTETRVMLIKKMLADPKRKTRQKMIARQFGVSEMQISRIKSGENWGNVKF